MVAAESESTGIDSNGDLHEFSSLMSCVELKSYKYHGRQKMILVQEICHCSITIISDSRGSARRQAPGCVNAAGKARQTW